jgi:hypothetical protein
MWRLRLCIIEAEAQVRCYANPLPFMSVSPGGEADITAAAQLPHIEKGTDVGFLCRATEFPSRSAVSGFQEPSMSAGSRVNPSS